MTIQFSDLDQVSKLSHLKFSEQERADYLSQLQSILGHMDELNQLELPELGQDLSIETPLREDIVIATQLPLEKNAPSWEENCFQVPKMLEDA